jgi:hypothetical protein
MEQSPRPFRQPRLITLLNQLRENDTCGVGGGGSEGSEYVEVLSDRSDSGLSEFEEPESAPNSQQRLIRCGNPQVRVLQLLMHSDDI